MKLMVSSHPWEERAMGMNRHECARTVFQVEVTCLINLTYRLGGHSHAQSQFTGPVALP